MNGALVKMEWSRSQSLEEIGRKAMGLRRRGRTIGFTRSQGSSRFEVFWIFEIILPLFSLVHAPAPGEPRRYAIELTKIK